MDSTSLLQECIRPDAMVTGNTSVEFEIGTLDIQAGPENNLIETKAAQRTFRAKHNRALRACPDRVLG